MRPITPAEIRDALSLLAQEACFHLRQRDNLTSTQLAGILGLPRAYVRGAEELKTYVPMKALSHIIDAAGMSDRVGPLARSIKTRQ